MKYDIVLREIGEFGRAQRLIYVLLCLTMITCSLQNIVWKFLSNAPKQRCQLTIDKLNKSTPFELDEEFLNMSIPRRPDGKGFDNCTRFGVTFTSTHSMTNFSVIHNDLSINPIPEYCNTYVYDSSQFESTVVTDFNLVCNRTWQKDLGNHAYSAGGTLGYFVTGNLADRFGRRPVFIGGLWGSLIFSLLLCISPNYFIVFLFRFLLGMFTVSVYLSSLIMVLEFIGPTKRTAAFLATAYFYAFGFALLAVLAYFIRRWWILQLVISVPGVAYIGYWWLIPESGRWLMTRRKYKAAKLLLERSVRLNNTSLSQNILSELAQQDVSALVDKKKITTSLLVTSKLLRRTSLILFYNFAVNYCIYTGLSNVFSFNDKGNVYLIFCVSGVIEAIAHTICIFVLTKCGRRFPFCIATICASVLYIICNSVTFSNQITLAVLAMLGRVFIVTAFSTILLFSNELYPTVVRGTGVGMCLFSAYVGDTLAPSILRLNEYWPPLTSVVFAIFAVSGSLAVVLFLPETNNNCLPDLLEDIEDKEAAESGIPTQDDIPANDMWIEKNGPPGYTHSEIMRRPSFKRIPSTEALQQFPTEEDEEGEEEEKTKNNNDHQETDNKRY